MEWLGASKKGLEKIAKRRGYAYVLLELIQNCWDTNATSVYVTFAPVAGLPRVDLVVVDNDPDGFKDLSHAYTLFAESEKKGDPTKRGRFNLGEKLVLAVCESATIESTTGTVMFDDRGRHEFPRSKREHGSKFEGRIKMTREDLNAVLRVARELIPPPGIVTTINGEQIKPRAMLKEFEATLPTETVDEEGYLKKTARKTTVRVYAAMGRPVDDTSDTAPQGWIYEMGIPVCPTGDPWDVEIMQKVPVNMERNSVSPSYLRTLRVLVLNEMHTLLKKEDAAKPAIQDALTDGRIVPAAIETVLTHQFGEKRAVFDPSDREANNRLTSEGYVVISGGSFSKDAWANIRASGAALPSGQIRPTPKPYSTDPNAQARELLPESDWTPGMHATAAYARTIAKLLLDRDITVNLDKGDMGGHIAAYGNHELTFSLGMLNERWFEKGVCIDLHDVLLHEFAHEFEANHLDDRFHQACTLLGARLAGIALSDPHFFMREQAQGWDRRRA